MTMDELSMLAIDLDIFATWVTDHFISYAEGVIFGEHQQQDESSPSVIRRLLTETCATLKTTSYAVWRLTCSLTASLCKSPALNNIRAIAGKFRMTNKAKPDQPSFYVASIFEPLIKFRSNIGAKVGVTSLCFLPTNASTRTTAPQWVHDIANEVADEFLVQAHALLETAKTMDSALQRRSLLASSKKGTMEGSGAMSDSKKIALQVWLDVKAFGAELVTMGVETNLTPAYMALVAATNRD